MADDSPALISSSYEWQPLTEDVPLPGATAGVGGGHAPGTLGVAVAWFVSSALGSTWANTAFLREMGSPTLHAAVRFGTSALLGLGTIAMRSHDGLALRHVPRTCVQLWQPAACLLAANLFNSLALQMSGITICYVVKSGIPVLTVIYCMLRGEAFPLAMLAAVVPIVLGVALASLSDSEYCAAGLAAAVGSAVAQTTLNLTSKRALSQLGLTGAQGQCMLTCCCTVAVVPLYLLSSVFAEATPTAAAPVGPGTTHAWDALCWRSVALVLATGIAYHSEYSLNFAFVRLVSPLAFSVADVARRLAVIIAGAIIFNKPLTMLNAAGVALSLGGVLCFLWASRQPRTRKRARQPGRSK